MPLKILSLRLALYKVLVIEQIPFKRIPQDKKSLIKLMIDKKISK